MDRKTKNALWEFWIKGGDNEVLMDDIVSSDGKREESDNTNHLNDDSGLFSNLILMLKKGTTFLFTDDEEIILLNEEVCKTERFEDLTGKKKSTLVEYLYSGILCVIVMLVSRPASTHNLAHKRNMENHSKQFTLHELLEDVSKHSVKS
ncbi:hypothetical protein Tco_0686297 [Tanacetum coccineum]